MGAPRWDWEAEAVYDGGCSVCTKEMALLRRLDRRRRIRFTDFTAPGFDPTSVGREHETLMATMHVRLPDGRLVTGVEAFRTLYGIVASPRLVALTRLPGISHALEAGYDWFAANRWRWTTTCADGACHVPSAAAKTTPEAVPVG